MGETTPFCCHAFLGMASLMPALLPRAAPGGLGSTGRLAGAAAAASTMRARLFKGALTSKKGPIGYYKGSGARRTGRHTKIGGYLVRKRNLPVFARTRGHRQL